MKNVIKRFTNTYSIIIIIIRFNIYVLIFNLLYIFAILQS